MSITNTVSIEFSPSEETCAVCNDIIDFVELRLKCCNAPLHNDCFLKIEMIMPGEEWTIDHAICPSCKKLKNPRWYSIVTKLSQCKIAKCVSCQRIGVLVKKDAEWIRNKMKCKNCRNIQEPYTKSYNNGNDVQVVRCNTCFKGSHIGGNHGPTPECYFGTAVAGQTYKCPKCGRAVLYEGGCQTLTCCSKGRKCHIDCDHDKACGHEWTM